MRNPIHTPDNDVWRQQCRQKLIELVAAYLSNQRIPRDQMEPELLRLIAHANGVMRMGGGT